jgi:D-threo-aldose 1-dehydrogenase
MPDWTCRERVDDRGQVSDDWLRPLGETGLVVSAIGAGGGPLGNMPETFGSDVDADQGIATVRRILAGPITFLDTSNVYGGGDSERRIGRALGEVGGLPAGFVLATKVDRGADGSFDAARVRRSFEESLQRLGLDRIQLLFLHDPEFAVTFDDAMTPNGAVPALVRIKDEGLAGVIGVAGGEIALMRRFVETGAFDVLLTHSRYSLVDRSADETITIARERGVAVVNAAVLGGGILAVGTSRSTRYGYREAPGETLTAVAAIEDVCRRHGVPLAAAAMQFSLRDERISSTLVGFSRPERVDETVRLAHWPIPDELWSDVEGHVPAPGVWLW